MSIEYVLDSDKPTAIPQRSRLYLKRNGIMIELRHSNLATNQEKILLRFHSSGFIERCCNAVTGDRDYPEPFKLDSAGSVVIN